MGDVRIARTQAERRAIYRLRYDVYVEEQGKPYTATTSGHELCDEIDDACTHFYLADERGLIGAARAYLGPLTVPLEQAFCSVDQSLPAERFHYTSRLCLAPAARHGLASWHLAKAAYLHGRSAGVEISFLHCAPHLTRLYGRLGYESYRLPFDHPVVGVQVPLRLFAADEAWLRSRLSPFAPLASAFRGCGPDWRAAVRQTFHPDALLDAGTLRLLLGE